MEHDPLSTLLEQADAAANPAPAAPPDLATRVRQRAARQREHRRAATALAATAAIALAASLAFRAPKPTQIANPSPAPADVAQLKREYARLTADADLHEQVLRRIVAHERAAAALAAATDPRLPPDPDPAAAIAAEVERSALILLRRGERLLADPDAKAQAADAFRRIVAHFPDSRGAATAREHLERIGA